MVGSGQVVAPNQEDGRAGLHQQRDAHPSLHGSKVGEGLWLTVLAQAEVFRAEVGDEAPFDVHDGHVHIHKADVHAQGWRLRWVGLSRQQPWSQQQNSAGQ